MIERQLISLLYFTHHRIVQRNFDRENPEDFQCIFAREGSQANYSLEVCFILRNQKKPVLVEKNQLEDISHEEGF